MSTFQPYRIRRRCFSGNSDFYKNVHVDIYWLWIDRMYESVNFVLGLSSLYLGSNIQCHLDYLLQRGVNALRALWTNRAVQCQSTKKPSPRRKKHEKIWQTSNFLEHFLDDCQKIFAHCQRTFCNFYFVGVRSFLFLCYHCKQISRLKVRRLRRGSARIL